MMLLNILINRPNTGEFSVMEINIVPMGGCVFFFYHLSSSDD